MFDVNFSYVSSTPLPPNVPLDAAIATLHDFETIIRLSPDCRGCKAIPPPKNAAKTNGAITNGNNAGPGDKPTGEMQYFEVEDDLPFMPKRLWSGGVKYQADFLPVQDGCDITVHAPGGFTSTNHWRLHREVVPDAIPEDSFPQAIPEDGVPQAVPENSVPQAIPENSVPESKPALDRTISKDMWHERSQGYGWYVKIVSDARCNRTFVGIVKGFLKNSHDQLQHAFIDRLKESVPARTRRPTLGRRRSSVF